MSEDLVRATTVAVRQAGARLLKRYSTAARQPGLPELLADLRANDLTVVDVLEPALAEIVPEARWLNDEHGSGPLPDGAWWLIDPVGGNLNAVHGMTDWNIGVSLVRDVCPVLVVLPSTLAVLLYTALVRVAGGGAG